MWRGGHVRSSPTPGLMNCDAWARGRAVSTSPDDFYQEPINMEAEIPVHPHQPMGPSNAATRPGQMEDFRHVDMPIEDTRHQAQTACVDANTHVLETMDEICHMMVNMLAELRTVERRQRERPATRNETQPWTGDPESVRAQRDGQRQRRTDGDDTAKSELVDKRRDSKIVAAEPARTFPDNQPRRQRTDEKSAPSVTTAEPESKRRRSTARNARPARTFPDNPPRRRRTGENVSTGVLTSSESATVIRRRKLTAPTTQPGRTLKDSSPQRQRTEIATSSGLGVQGPSTWVGDIVRTSGVRIMSEETFQVKESVPRETRTPDGDMEREGTSERYLERSGGNPAWPILSVRGEDRSLSERPASPVASNGRAAFKCGTSMIGKTRTMAECLTMSVQHPNTRGLVWAAAA